MTYKGYEILANCNTLEVWTVNSDGELDDWSYSYDGVEVDSYFTEIDGEHSEYFDTIKELEEYIDGLEAAK